MISIQESPETFNTIENVLLQWIRLYPRFSAIASLNEITDGSFILETLEQLQNFKLLQPVIDFEGEQTLGSKVAVVKNIVKSLFKFHQKVLMKNISSLEVNYVEFCMGNKNQIIKILTILISALMSSQSSKNMLMDSISQMDQQSQEMMKIMIQNATHIGEPVNANFSPNRSWKLSAQKQVYAKMEELQYKVQELEYVNKKLLDEIRHEKQVQASMGKQNESMKKKVRNLIERNQQLEEMNEKASADLHISAIQGTATKKKLENTEKALKKRIQDLIIEIDHLKDELAKKKYLQIQNQQLHEINKEIKEQNMQMRKDVSCYDRLKVELKQKEREHRQQIILLTQKNSELEVKVSQLVLEIQQICKGRQNYRENGYETSYFGYPECDGESNIYRLKDSLSVLKNNEEEPNFLDNTSAIRNMNNNSLYTIKSIAQRSNENDSKSPDGFFNSIKQNQSVFMNDQNMHKHKQHHNNNNKDTVLEKEVECMSQNQVENMNKDNEEIGKIVRKRVQKQKQRMDNYYKQQIDILINTILQLQDNLSHQRLQIKDSYNSSSLLRSSVNDSKMMKFKQKVQQILMK